MTIVEGGEGVAVGCGCVFAGAETVCVGDMT
jgi:hypothetical protein